MQNVKLKAVGKMTWENFYENRAIRVFRKRMRIFSTEQSGIMQPDGSFHPDNGKPYRNLYLLVK